MTKTANSSTKSPDALGLPGYVFADDYVANLVEVLGDFEGDRDIHPSGLVSAVVV